MYQSDDEAENRQLEQEVYAAATIVVVFVLFVIYILVKKAKQ